MTDAEKLELIKREVTTYANDDLMDASDITSWLISFLDIEVNEEEDEDDDY
jgi:hypothetical protein